MPGVLGTPRKPLLPKILQGWSGATPASQFGPTLRDPGTAQGGGDDDGILEANIHYEHTTDDGTAAGQQSRNDQVNVRVLCLNMLTHRPFMLSI